MPDITGMLGFLLLGLGTGFMAGLLGIGGGAIMVPVLTMMFLRQGLPEEAVVHLALGTSMAAIIFTSIASLRAHHARGAVLWPVVWHMAPGIVLGTFLATFLAARASPLFLATFFALFMAAVSLQMFLDARPAPGRTLAGRGGLLLAGSGIGAVSALVSIGGGSLTVPFLLWQNVDMRQAIGTSAAIGLPISLAGSLGYVIHGWGATAMDHGRLGFVHLPALVLIAMASYLAAPWGARLAHGLPVAQLRRIFACLLLVLSGNMLRSIL